MQRSTDVASGWAWVLVLAGLAACGRAAVEPTKPPPAVEVPPATPTSAAPPEATDPTDGFLELPVAGAPNSLTSDPTVFECAGKPCQVGKQTCCGTGERGVCVDSLSAQQDGKSLLSPQEERCQAETHDQQYARCDESIDCGERDICCEQLLVSGRIKVVCESPLTSGATPCDFGELCQPNSPCRVPGTECRRVTLTPDELLNNCLS